MANRLGRATSPYLLQHADNPVDWWEWSPEAFDEARRRDLPVLLSVGYAACHWCHVMAHESFEDETVAAAVNAGFVAVKVDREERPDIDAVYMAATTALTGSGGWPMTCLLTPSGDPFFAGTYFPRAQLLALLANAGQVWRTRRDDVERSGARIAEQLRSLTSPPDPGPLTGDDLGVAVDRLALGFDTARGGFGTAPKFPPSMVLELLARHHARTGSAPALAMLDGTLDGMARGGMYDQLAGGFARYAVDAGWVVPHFEKMLYDNAQLARVYAHRTRITEHPLAARIATETCDFIVAGLGTPEGGFASALDADTIVDGQSHEGLTYAWTPAQLVQVLGDADGERARDLLGVTAAGTFEHGASTLQLRSDPDDPTWWADTRRRLLAARALRPQPSRDDKVVTSWNGLALAALADAGVVLGRPDLVDAARRCADHLLATHVVDGRLRRVSRDGVVGPAAGVLDDHGNLAEGLLALHQATGDPAYLAASARLLDVTVAHFRDAGGIWHDTADDAEVLVTRPRSDSDNAEPSGLSSVAGALLTYAALTGSPEHRQAAEDALAQGAAVAVTHPRFAGWRLAVAEAVAAGPLQVAVVGSGTAAEELLGTTRRSPSPGLVLAHGQPDAEGQPLLAGRPLVGGQPTAYVCRGFVCDAPVTDPVGLAARLADPADERG